MLTDNLVKKKYQLECTSACKRNKFVAYIILVDP